MAPPLRPSAMPISSRHTPGSRTEWRDRKASTQSHSRSPSVMRRRQSSAWRIFSESIHILWPA